MIGLIRSSRLFFCKATEMIEKERTKISKFELKNFSDSAKLNIKAGNGGYGVLTYYTDKRIRVGAPDGGDGGNGGSIVVEAQKSMHDLSHLRLKSIEGVDGQRGGMRCISKAHTVGRGRMAARLCSGFRWALSSTR